MTQPKLITKPFADDALPGYVNEIPKENPVGAPEQNASWAVGFPPITMTDIDDGGLPPNGEDMNGVLRAITEHNLFIGGGGVYEFTDEYITEVGGYNKGAVLVSNDKTALWMSIQDNNTQNFNGATRTQWRRIAFTELDSTLASIQDALNTKADKSVTITAGDGLTGGGTLAGNRVLAVNSSVVRTDRTITAGTGLSGGGDLSANRTLSVNYGTTAGTAAQGNDSRIVNSVQTSGNQTISGLKTFSQFPVTPSAAPTANYQAANKKYVDDSVAVPVDQIFTFESALPPEGYIARNGQAIDSARMPKLFARYGANMPDDRNRVYRMQGDLTGAVGSLQEDAIQNFYGQVDMRGYDSTGVIIAASGVFSVRSSQKSQLTAVASSLGGLTEELSIDVSRAARSASETRVKSRIVIFCNKIQ